MDKLDERRFVVNQINSYMAAIESSGIPFQRYTDDELAAMELPDLQRILRSLRDLARTPH